jgi:hypothetical protein
VDRVVELGDVGGGELLWGITASLGDDGLGDLVERTGGSEPEIFGAEYLGECSPRARCFGRLASFWSRSKVSAARRELKDLRRRRPVASRQSA